MFTARELVVIELSLCNRRDFLNNNPIPAADEKILEINQLLTRVRAIQGVEV